MAVPLSPITWDGRGGGGWWGVTGDAWLVGGRWSGVNGSGLEPKQPRTQGQVAVLRVKSFVRAVPTTGVSLPPSGSIDQEAPPVFLFFRRILFPR